MDAELDAVLDAVRSLGHAEGLRVNEICAALSSPLSPSRVVALLERAALAGIVRRDPMGGRWHLTSLGGSTLPPLREASQRPSREPKTSASTPPVVKGLPEVEDAGIPSAVDDEGLVDPSQRAVVRAACDVRQIVVAGPGFGKTAVACGRVAWLLRSGIEPARILLLSFTRTAVREIRARITTMAREVADAASVEARTLDSFAWRVRTGLSESPREGQGFSENIAATVKMIAHPDDELRDYLQRFDHIVVDEAQDLVGARAELVASLLGALRSDAGYTVFLDPAQAIYDWSEDAEKGEASRSFESRLRELRPSPTWHELCHLHRTRDARLRALLLGARRVVLDAPDDAYTRIRSALESRAGETWYFADKIAEELSKRDTGDLMVLARRRGEALELSTRLTQIGVRHRLRFGSLPQLAAPWIALVLNEAYRQRESFDIEKADVESAWETMSSSNAWICAGWEFETAWRLLRRIGAGRTKQQVDIRRVATRLGAATLPDDALLREPGGSGPIVSTIHGSKGREAAEAILLLTTQHERVLDEARVLYVGLSRAKERLDVRRFGGMHWGHLPRSGRPWRRAKSGLLQIEVGRVGDLDLLRTATTFAGKVAEQQAHLATFDGACRSVRVWSFKDKDWARCVVTDGAEALPLAALSRDCEGELREAARAATKDSRARTPTHVNHLRWFDLGSVGLPPDAMPECELPEPWRSTRLFLMPLIVGPGVAGGFE